MAIENPGWGYTRIRGALRNIGHELGRSKIKRILAQAGIEPAPALHPQSTAIVKDYADSPPDEPSAVHGGLSPEARERMREALR